MDKTDILPIVFLLTLSSILCSIIYLSYANINNDDFEIVVSHYSEDLHWLSNPEFNNYSAIIYNKGKPESMTPEKIKDIKNIKKIEHIQNVGREAHTYLYHVIQNYHNLAKVTIFLPGSVTTNIYGHEKYQKAKLLMENLDTHRDTVFVGRVMDNFKEDQYDVQLEDWNSTSESNNKEELENRLKPASIRPFGKWFEDKFPNVIPVISSGFSIFAISKQDIIQHPIEYYKDLIQDLETSSNPEAGHYFERAWYAVFYPYNNAKLVDFHW